LTTSADRTFSARSLRSGQLTRTGYDDRHQHRRVAITWALLLFNVMPYSADPLLPIPGAVGKLLVQAALPLAFFLALSVNRRLNFRPSVFLCLVSLLALETVVTAVASEYPKGTLFRTFRMLDFVVILWLLSPYWGRGRDGMLLARFHMKALFFIVCTVLLGLVVAPGLALGTGRLVGVIWPIPATQAAHYAAVVIGMAIILWFCKLMRGRDALVMVVVSVVVLILTHARTALLAGVVALIVAGLSLFPTNPRVRKTLAIAVGVCVLAAITVASAIGSWLARGQNAQQLSGLTGRTGFWGPLLAYPRDPFEMIFGFGLSNGQFRGLPIDSNWLDSYQDQGLYGDIFCGLIIIFLIVAACVQTRGVNRALALFLAVYILVASFTEDGITNPSPYMLDAAIAASLIAGPLVTRMRLLPSRRTPPPPPPPPPWSEPPSEPSEPSEASPVAGVSVGL
jgi:hypothetical protein